MNYSKIYYNLIESRKLLNRKKYQGVYYESHHIIPRCFGGKNDETNLILLTAREHFIAHLLLTYMYVGKDRTKMTYALSRMCQINKNQERIISSKQYEMIKFLIHQNCSGKNATFYGKTFSEESLKKMRDAKLGEKNPNFGKPTWNKGIACSEETKEKLRKANKGKNKGRKLSEETCEKMSKASKGKPKSEMHKKAISNTLKGRKLPEEVCKKMSVASKGKKQKIIKCPYCDKKGGTTMYRWHFNNCKNK